MKTKEEIKKAAEQRYNAIGCQFDACSKEGFIAGYTQALEDMKNDAVEFAEWAGNNYVKLHGVWCLKYSDQRDKSNWKTTAELLTLFRERKVENGTAK